MIRQSGALAAVLAAAMGWTLGTAALAAEFDVKMLNQGESGKFVFEPALLRISVGDTVHFRAVDKHHVVGNKRGMVPEGAMPFKGKRSEDHSVTFNVLGVYGYECFVHIHSFGMVGLIVVGDDLTNLATVKQAAAKSNPKEQERFQMLFAQLEGG